MSLYEQAIAAARAERERHRRKTVLSAGALSALRDELREQRELAPDRWFAIPPARRNDYLRLAFPNGVLIHPRREGASFGDMHASRASPSRRVGRVTPPGLAPRKLGWRRRLIELGVRGLDASPHFGENLELLLCDVIEEQLADVGEVPLVGAAQRVAARRGDSRVVPAKIVGTAGAGDEAVALEAIGQPREAAGGHEQLRGKLPHPQPGATAQASRSRRS